MASQTKVEPAERVGSATAPGVGGSEEAEAVQDGRRDPSEDGELTQDVRSGNRVSSLNDDEDVSLDELMISDSSEADEEQDEATDVHVAIGRPIIDAGVDTEAPESLLARVAGPEPNLLEDDEAAARAAAAAAQEAAAQGAQREAAARAASVAAEAAITVEAAEAEAAEAEAVEAEAAEAEAAEAEAAEAEAAPVSMTVDVDEFELEPESTSDVNASAAESVEPSALDERVDSGEFEVGAEIANSEAVDGEARSNTEPPPLLNADGELMNGGRISEPPPTPRRDGPLPSFDIPEAEAASGASRAAGNGNSNLEGRASNRTGPRPMVAPLAQLSEAAEEDDDDAVTHIGLPVPEADNDYPIDGGGFQVADPRVTALASFDSDESPADTRRATTRVVQRIDPSQLALRGREIDTAPGVVAGRPALGRAAEWSRIFRGWGARHARGGLGSAETRRRSASWLIDNVLRPGSLVLFGSGLGALIMLLQTDRGAKASQQTQAVQALKEGPTSQGVVRQPTTLVERAEAGEGDALFKITNMSTDERTSVLTLALERGYQTQKLNEFKEFARTLEATEGAPPANLTARFLGYATSPETMLPAFAHLSQWTGSRGPEVLYAVWEKAPGGSRAASLAQQLLHSADQRAKATPSLKTALDLRAATTCDDYLRVLPVVLRDGDQRCSATLRALKHKDGCGDDGQQDCYACLRETSLLDDALAAIENRVPPQL